MCQDSPVGSCGNLACPNILGNGNKASSIAVSCSLADEFKRSSYVAEFSASFA